MTPLPSPAGRRCLRRRALLAGWAALPLAACGSGDPAYYTLAPVAGAPRPGGPSTVEVRTPSIAAYLDRDTIVRNDVDGRLTLADAAWAGGLAEMIGRTLALDLGQRLPGSTVFTQNGAISAEALARVELDVSRFMADAQGRAEIEATLAVSRPGGVASGRSLHLTGAARDGSVGALVAALGEVLGQVADIAAEAVRTLPPAR